MTTSQGFALNAFSAAISTPVNANNSAPTLVVLSGGSAVHLSGAETLAALREAIDHALGRPVSETVS